MAKVVINKCFGGFNLSDAAYEKLIEWGVPVMDYVEELRGPDGRFVANPVYDTEVIIRGHGKFGNIFGSEYWDCWTSEKRDHPLVVRVVEELGEAASGMVAKLVVVEVPDGVEWAIEEYDGLEHVAEVHRTWR